MKKAFLILLSLGLVIAVSSCGGGAQPAATPAPTAAPTAAPVAESIDTAGIAVSDQPIIAGVIVVDYAFADNPAWIGIHESDASGAKGKLVGYAWLSQDATNEAIPVLLEDGVEAEYLMAALYRDKGKNIDGIPDGYPEPGEPYTFGFEEVFTVFQVLPPPVHFDFDQLEVYDQVLMGGELVVNSVYTNQPSWVVAWSVNADGNVVDVIGLNFVDGGLVENLPIFVDSAAIEKNPLAVITVNPDMGEQGIFEMSLDIPSFNENDEPVMSQIALYLE